MPEKKSQEIVAKPRPDSGSAAKKIARKEASARALRENLKKRKRRFSEKTPDGDSE